MSLSAPATSFQLGLENRALATPMYPPARELFFPFRAEATPAAVASSLASAGPRIGLYLHVPFCETRCAWCDYAVVTNRSAAIDEYVAALGAELETAARALPGTAELAGLDIGGGTPALLQPRHFEVLLSAVARRFRLAPGFEVSTETTLALAGRARPWAEILSAGLRRVSIGVQTADGSQAARLGRPGQDASRLAAAVESLRQAGARMVNVDLMFGLPGDTEASWSQTLDAAVAAAPDVITTYDTVYKRRPIGRSAQPPLPAVFGRLYDLAFGRLGAAGYSARYGSVNFSRVPGRLGTSRYLEARLLEGADYLGVGLYASSLFGATWRFSRAGLESWMSAALSGRLAAEDLYELPVEHRMAKHLLLALTYGYLDAGRFERRFGEPLESRFGAALEWLVHTGSMRRCADGWELLPGTFSRLPGIRACFMPEDALASLAQVPARGSLASDR